MVRGMMNILEKLDAGSDVNQETGCWEWRTSKGSAYSYGKVRHMGKNNNAHRLCYELLRGSVDGLDLDHLCRNPCCINPAHLEPVTHKENLKRGKVNQYKDATHCKNGHTFSGSNLRVQESNGQRVCKACERACHDRKRKKKSDTRFWSAD